MTMSPNEAIKRIVSLIVDDSEIGQAAHEHALEEMGGHNIEVPEDLSECAIYWTLRNEFLTSATARALAQIVTKI